MARRLMEKLWKIEEGAGRRCRQSRKWKDADREAELAYEILSGLLPKECRSILHDYENAINGKNSIAADYTYKEIFRYGLSKGLRIESVTCNE